MQNKIQIFEKQPVRAIWDEENEKWWFSIIDVIMVLTDQPDYSKARNYWKWLKNKLKNEGSELVSHTNQLKIEADDGKKYKTAVADTEQVLRLIQSIPNKKAEPFKMWLAKVGNERIDETIAPELSIGFRQKITGKQYANDYLKSVRRRSRRDRPTLPVNFWRKPRTCHTELSVFGLQRKLDQPAYQIHRMSAKL